MSSSSAMVWLMFAHGADSVSCGVRSSLRRLPRAFPFLLRHTTQPSAAACIARLPPPMHAAARRVGLDALMMSLTSDSDVLERFGPPSLRQRYEIQSDYWPPVVLCRQMSCPCSGSEIRPVFSECSGENVIEEAL